MRGGGKIVYRGFIILIIRNPIMGFFFFQLWRIFQKGKKENTIKTIEMKKKRNKRLRQRQRCLCQRQRRQHRHDNKIKWRLCSCSCSCCCCCCCCYYCCYTMLVMLTSTPKLAQSRGRLCARQKKNTHNANCSSCLPPPSTTSLPLHLPLSTPSHSLSLFV